MMECQEHGYEGSNGIIGSIRRSHGRAFIITIDMRNWSTELILPNLTTYQVTSLFSSLFASFSPQNTHVYIMSIVFAARYSYRAMYLYKNNDSSS